jgi:hypothetical protein
MAAMAVREITGMKNPVASRLPKVDQLKDGLLVPILRNVSKFYRKLAKDTDGDSVARGPSLLKSLNSQWDRKKKRDAKKA